MRPEATGSGTRRRYWVLAMVLAAGLVSAGTASAGPGNKDKGAKETAGKADAGKEHTGKDGTQVKRVELVVQVRDDAGKPVRGAAVSVVSDDLEIEQRSDGHGQAKFRDLPVGLARVQAVATGWNASGRKVTLDGERVQVDLALTPRKPPADGTAAGHGGASGREPHAAGKGRSGPEAADEAPTRSRVQTAVDDLPDGQSSQPRAPGAEATTGGQGAAGDPP